MIVEKITQALQHALAEFGVSDAQIELEHPADASFGDWSTNAALQYVKQTDQFKNPREFAQALQEKITELLRDTQEIENIAVAGPGFINFALSQQYWLDTANKLHSAPSALAHLPKSGKGKKAIVEYSSPNIAKPFTVGHLRSTIIGDAIANVYEALGWSVFRDNHLGDWGTQFGKLIYALKTWGDREAIAQSEKPIQELVNLYVQFHREAEDTPELNDFGREWFKKLEDGDGEAREIWQWCVDLSWQEFDRIYAELGVSFTENNGRGYGEAFFENRMQQVLEILEEKLPPEKSQENGGHYSEGDDGAKLVFFEEGTLPSLMIVKKDGATLYATRDLATDYFRLEHYDSPTLVINEVGAEQSLYFQQLYRVEEMLGWYKPGQRVHVKHGLYRFKDRKMATRKGDVIWLEDVISQAKERALALSKGNEAVAAKVAIGALKWNDLKSETARDIAFSWDEVLSMKGNSGPYVQYAAVRAQSILTKAGGRGEFSSNVDLAEEELALIRYLARFSEAVQKAADEFAPHHIAGFLFETAQRFNTFYNQHPILTASESAVRERRVALTALTHAVLRDGLRLLGIQTPEEM